MADTDELRRDGRAGEQRPAGRAKPTFGSLFAGIGGIDLGLERAGWECRFQVEWDDYCQHILAHHWPDVPRFGDIHDVHGPGAAAHTDGEGEPTEPVDAEPRSGLVVHGGCLPAVDLLAGGFPCQPFSHAGRRRGMADERWLWPEFARLIGELRPRLVLVENVPGLLARHGGMGRVLGDLAALGYDASWDSIPAAAVGAPHLRYRVWIVAYANGHGQGRSPALGQAGESWLRPQQAGAEPDGADHRGGWPAFDWWRVEPDVGRMAHGVPARVDRLRALGNAVVPQVVEVIGRRMIEMLP